MPIEQQEISEQLKELLDTARRRDVEAFLSELPVGDVARAVSRLTDEEQERLLTRLKPDDAAELVERLPDSQVAEIVERLEPAAAARILEALPSDEQADLIGDLAGADADAILAAMPAADAAEVRALAEYPPETAGGLMVTEFLAYPVSATVGDVLRDMRENAETYADYEVQYAYVTTYRKLVGVLRLRDLLLRPAPRTVASVMIEDPRTIPVTAGLDELRDFFDRHAFLGAPVVDAAGRLLGVVRRTAVEEALAERSDSDYLKASGIVGGEELRSMPVLLRSRRRLVWLSLNVVLNIVAASVIAVYQDTLQAAIALAVFLPIISDMSGCSGNQAVAVTMRELTMGLVQPRDALRVWLKEAVVGLINGVVLGVLIAAAAFLWKSNAWLGLVVGGALAANTLVAVSIGGTVPLLLRRLGFDPALASGPVLTTVTDMCGFFLTLTFAAGLLDRLVA